MGWLNADRCSGVMFIRARMYAVRNSDGNSSGSVSLSDLSAVADFSSSFSASLCGGLISVGCIWSQMPLINAGIGTEKSGFLVRIINVVLAIYNGNAANTNMPNTKPGKPRNSARIRCRQCAIESISKLNRNLNTSHIIAV